MPSASPSRSIFQSIVTSTDRELRWLSNTGDTSYGYLFDVRTTPTGPAIVLTGLEFYPDKTGPINYELWSREGSYDGFRGTYEGWDLIASGTVQGQGTGRYTSIPEDDFLPVDMPGGGVRTGGVRAFYLTLNTKDLLSRGSGGPAGQAQASTPELELRAGEAVLSYPFPDPSQSSFYQAPQEFVGVVRYDRLPCRPFPMYGFVAELPCPVSFPTASPALPATAPPTGRPTEPIPTSSPTPRGPTAAPTTSAPIMGTAAPTATPTRSPVKSPTLSPTVSHAPTASHPPTDYPTASPVVPIRTYLVMSLHGIPDGQEEMTQREAIAFVLELTYFLNRHTGERLIVDGVGLWDQQLVAAADGKAGTGTALPAANATQGADPSSTQVSRGASMPRRLKRRGESETSERERAATPEANALQLVLILKISFTTLPSELLGNMAAVTIRENRDELLERIRGLGGEYPLFANITGVEVSHIDKLEKITSPPASSPAETNATIAAEFEDGEETGPKVGVIAGAVMGSFWLCSAAIGLLYLRKARSRMSHRKAAETLTKSQQDPIKFDPTILGSERNSSRTIPMGTSGTDWDADGSWNDGDRREIESTKKAALTNSLTAGLQKFDSSKWAYSDVAERKSMLGTHGEGRRGMLFQSDSQICINVAALGSSITTPAKPMLSSSGSRIAVADDMAMPEKERGAPVNRRNMLSRSDSQIALDTSALTDQSEQHNQSMTIPEFKGATPSKRSATNTVRNNRKSLTLSATSQQSNNLRKSANSHQGNARLRKSSVRSQHSNSIRKSTTSQHSNTPLRQSLLNTEFDASMLFDQMVRSTDLPKAASNSPGSSMRRSVILKGNNLKRSNTSQGSNPRKSFVDSEIGNPKGRVVSTQRYSTNNGNREVTRSGSHLPKLDSSMTKRRPSKSMSQSMRVPNAGHQGIPLKRSLSKDGHGQQGVLRKSSNQENKSTIGKEINRDSINTAAKRKSRDGNRLLSQSVTPSKSNSSDDRAKRENRDGRRSLSQSVTPFESNSSDHRASLAMKRASNGSEILNALASGVYNDRNESDRRSLGRKSVERPSLKKSGTRAGSTDLRQSRVMTSSDPVLQKSVTKGSRDSLQRLEGDGRDDTKRTAARGQPGDNRRRASHSVTIPRTHAGKTSLRQSRVIASPDPVLRKSGTNGSRDSLQGLEGDGRDDTKRTAARGQSSDNRRRVSQSAIIPRTHVGRTSLRQSRVMAGSDPVLRKSVTKGSRDSLQRLEGDGRDDTKRTAAREQPGDNRRRVSQSATIPRTNAGKTSLRQSRVMAGPDPVQRLVTEARKQTGDTSKSVRQSMTVSRMNAGKASLRQSSTKGSPDAMQMLIAGAMKPNDGTSQSLRQSTTASRANGGRSSLMRSSRNSSADDMQGMQLKAKGSGTDAMRRSSTRSNGTSKDVRKSTRRRSSADLAGHRRSANRSSTRE